MAVAARSFLTFEHRWQTTTTTTAAAITTITTTTTTIILIIKRIGLFELAD